MSTNDTSLGFLGFDAASEDPPDIKEIKTKLAANALRRREVLKDQGYDSVSDDFNLAFKQSVFADPHDTRNLGSSTRGEEAVLLSLYYKFPDQLGNPRSGNTNISMVMGQTELTDAQITALGGGNGGSNSDPGYQGPNSGPYRNFFQISNTTATQVDAIVNKFNANRNAHSLLNITTGEASRLTPYIKLYKSQPIADNPKSSDRKIIEFPFNNRAFDLEQIYDNTGDLSFKDLLLDRRSRGADVGVTSVKWSFEGTDPITANKFIKLEANIFFSNIAGLTLLRDAKYGAGNAFKYSDLIARQADFNMQPGIHAQLGWSVPSNNEAFENKGELRGAIYLSRVSLDLNLMAHEFSFNDDGSCDLKIEYQSSLFTTQDQSGASNLLTPNMQQALQSLNWKKSDEARLKSMRSDLARKNAQQKRIGRDTSGPEGKLKVLEEKRNALKTAVISMSGKRLIENIQASKAIRTLRIPRELYYPEYQIWEILCPDLNYGEAAFKKFNLKGDKGMDNWNAILTPGTFAAINKGSMTYSNKRRLKGAIDAIKGRAVPKSARAEGDKAPSLKTDDVSSEGTYIDPSDGPLAKAALAALAKEGFMGQTAILNYLYVGDLIDAACELLKSNGLRRGDVGFPNMVFGTMPAFNPCVGGDPSSQEHATNKLVNIVNFPVDIETAFEFLDKNIIGKELKNYTILDFVHDIFTQIIPETLRKFDKESGTNLRFVPKIEIVHAKGHNSGKGKGPGQDGSMHIKNPLSTMPGEKGKPLMFPLSNADQIIGSQSDQKFMNEGDIRGSYTFVLCRMDVIGNEWLMGSKEPNQQRDFNNGVYWLALASRDGLVKGWSFSKIDAPYLAESRINGQGDLGRDISGGNLYNLSIDMVGNNLFKPGSIVFIDPMGLGFDSALAAELYIGGYYTVVKIDHEITDGDYTTTMELVFLRHVFNKKGSARLEQVANDATRQTAITGPAVDISAETSTIMRASASAFAAGRVTQSQYHELLRILGSGDSNVETQVQEIYSQWKKQNKKVNDKKASASSGDAYEDFNDKEWATGTGHKKTSKGEQNLVELAIQAYDAGRLKPYEADMNDEHYFVYSFDRE